MIKGDDHCVRLVSRIFKNSRKKKARVSYQDWKTGTPNNV